MNHSSAGKAPLTQNDDNYSYCPSITAAIDVDTITGNDSIHIGTSTLQDHHSTCCHEEPNLHLHLQYH